jgi:uncharacterized phiE125 gp8 family phage protein
MRSYGTLTLTLTSPAQTFVEPLTLAEVKTSLRLPDLSPSDAAQDNEITGMIETARHAAEWKQGREIARKQLDLALDLFPQEITLRSPLISVDLIQYKCSDGSMHTLTEGTDYIVDTARGLVRPVYAKAWPSFVAWPSSAVLIRHTAGDGYVHPMVKRGMLLLVNHLFVARLPYEMSTGVVTEYPFGVSELLGYGAMESHF